MIYIKRTKIYQTWYDVPKHYNLHYTKQFYAVPNLLMNDIHEATKIYLTWYGAPNLTTCDTQIKTKIYQTWYGAPNLTAYDTQIKTKIYQTWYGAIPFRNSSSAAPSRRGMLIGSELSCQPCSYSQSRRKQYLSLFSSPSTSSCNSLSSLFSSVTSLDDLADLAFLFLIFLASEGKFKTKLKWDIWCLVRMKARERWLSR